MSTQIGKVKTIGEGKESKMNEMLEMIGLVEILWQTVGLTLKEEPGEIANNTDLSRTSIAIYFVKRIESMIEKWKH